MEMPNKSTRTHLERCEPSPLTPAEFEQVVNEFNDTAVPYPRERLIHELFEAQAERSPEAVAVVSAEQELTYAQLNCRANQVAHALLARGVQPGDRVGLYAVRSVGAVVGLLGILKSGGAYVPLDPSYPPERLAFMIEDSSPVAVLTLGSLQVVGLNMPLIRLDEELLQPNGNPAVSGLTSHNLCYVIYTSGSTGKPKGVMVEHHSVVRLVVNVPFPKIRCEDCVAHCASLSFDAATWEVWAPLLNGARLLVVPQSEVLEPGALNLTLVRHAVTVMWLTVGLFNEYVDALEEAFSKLRYLLIGGDALNPSTVARALTKTKPPRYLINGYGPTETTTFASMYVITALAEGSHMVPIGRPIANTRIYILNDDREPVRIGITGEIYIGGAGVARGYLNEPELTAERFLPDPFTGTRDSRLYRSGDLGRWRADGNIEYLGRNDFQVKVRGFRVELGEIEAALQSQVGVKQAVVIARGDAPGEKRLVAYIAQGAEKCPSDEGLRAHLLRVLPEYMLPSAFVFLESFPLTANGKLDRHRLPAPKFARYPGASFEAPRGEIEEALAEIWQEVLRVERIGQEENFFQLGGHSLIGMQLIRRVAEKLSTQLPVHAVYQYPTVRKMAQLIQSLIPEGHKPLAPNQIGYVEGIV